MTFWGSHTLSAVNKGVIVGANFANIDDVSGRVAAGYHAGVTYKFNLPLGFAVQPALMYNLKSSIVESAIAKESELSLNVGYAELLTSIQWGPDLILFRPFVDVAPYIGYAVNNDFEKTTLLNNAISGTWENKWDGLNRLEYGFGVGLGLEIWKLQVVGRYNWNLGSLYNSEGKLNEWSEMLSNAKDSVLNGNNFSGVTLSVSLLF